MSFLHGQGTISSRVAGLREQVAALGRDVVEGGRGLTAAEAFELAGEAQALANAADGLVMALAAWGARVETELLESGPFERVHPVGFVDQMACSMVSLESGLTEGAAARKVQLGAALAERFPMTRDLVLSGDLTAVSAHKVVDACAGLDLDACEKVDAELAPRLAMMDPTRVTSEARRVAGRVAADQVAAHAARRRRVRTVEVRANEDGLTDWWALLPTATSAAMWSAVNQVAGDYRSMDEALTLDEARPDALADLVLRDVKVTAQVTLGVPVVSNVPDPEPTRTTHYRVERDDNETIVDADTGALVRLGDLDAASREAFCWVDEPVEENGSDTFTTMARLNGGTFVSGSQLSGLGWVDAATVANLLQALPMDVARAVLDADTGTLASLTTDAYKPTKNMRAFVETRDGTCRMWGCSRPVQRCDLHHVEPWPAGQTRPDGLAGLCRRHHRLKQRMRHRPVLDPDGTMTWTSPSGKRRVTEPAHRIPPPTPRRRPPAPAPKPAPRIRPDEPPPF